MKKISLIFMLLVATIFSAMAQTNAKPSVTAPTWTEGDRKYLLDNLTRSMQEITDETKNLTKDQWAFRESPDRWNINQIVEHIDLWEILLMHEISSALERAPDAGNSKYSPDSVFVDQYPAKSKKQDALNFTKPFSFAVPLGNNEGKNNVIWLTTMRNQSIDYLSKENKNIRLYYDCYNANVHQIYIILFGHADRHLKQIRKVKTHPNFPH